MKNLKFHFIGIGGISMSALAFYLKSCGYVVQGSDTHKSQIIDDLINNGINVFIGHKESNINYDCVVVYNYAIKNKGNIPSVIRLVNCVWHLPETDFLSEDAKVFYETKEMCEYKEFIFFYKATEEIRKRFEKLGFDFDILFLDAKEFVQQLSKNSEQLEYLKRYFL